MDVLTRFRRREKEKPATPLPPVYKSKEQCLEEIWAKKGEIIKVSVIKKSGSFYAVYGQDNKVLFLITQKIYDELK